MFEFKSYHSNFKTNVSNANHNYKEKNNTRNNEMIFYSKKFKMNPSIKSNVQQKTTKTTILRKVND